MKLMLAIALLAAATGAALAADPPAAKPEPAKKTCRWVSNCQTCVRGTDGRLRCSNIGIACQPKRQRCIPD